MIAVHVLLEDGGLQNLLSGWSAPWIYLKQPCNYLVEVARVLTWDFGVDAFRYFSEKAFHVLRLEWRVEGSHFIQDGT